MASGSYSERREAGKIRFVDGALLTEFTNPPGRFQISFNLLFFKNGFELQSLIA